MSKYKASRLKEKENAERKERMMKNILALSKKEIAILKFILVQDSYAAWLPSSYTLVIILAKKGLISLISNTSKNIPPYSRYYELRSDALLFTVPENIRKLINETPPQFIKKWRKMKPDSSLHIPPECDEYYRYGFEVIGLMLYGLCC